MLTCMNACMYVRLTGLQCFLSVYDSDSDSFSSSHLMSYSVLHQDENTALLRAARGGHAETVMSLLDRGADINHKDNVSYCDA